MIKITFNKKSHGFLSFHQKFKKLVNSSTESKEKYTYSNLRVIITKLDKENQ